jgi:hypothetical protein
VLSEKENAVRQNAIGALGGFKVAKSIHDLFLSFKDINAVLWIISSRVRGEWDATEIHTIY